MKINYFQGDLTDISAKKEALPFGPRFGSRFPNTLKHIHRAIIGPTDEKKKP